MKLHTFTRSVILLVGFFFSQLTHAQSVDIAGKLVDAATGDPVSYAHVSLMRAADSVRVENGLSDDAGRFFLQAKNGTFVLEVSFIGYETHYRNISLEGEMQQLGRINLSPSSKELQAVTVEGAAKLLSSDGEKRIYDVQKTILSEGGSAIDVLETLPSIQLDEEGNLSLRGSGNVLIYINGRPSNMSGDDPESVLEQFPADAIERVELITNPSSRYDAQGVGGIINIILKKNRLQGTNGQLNASVGNRNKYTVGGNVNYRKNKLNVNLGYSFQYRQTFLESETARQNTVAGLSPFFEQDYYTENYDPNHLLRLNADYNISETWVFTVFSNINYRLRDRERTYNTRHLDANRSIDSANVRNLLEEQVRYNAEGGFSLGWDSKDDRQTFTFMSSINHQNRDRIEFFDEQFFNEMGNEVFAEQREQIYGRPIVSTLGILQADYTNRIADHFTIEAGLKSTLNTEYREQTFESRDINSGSFETNSLIADQFTFNEHVHAAYFMAKDSWNRFSYQAGLRAEWSLTNSFQPKTDCTFVNNYFDLFPSAFVGYKVNEHIEMTGGYSRRINRPNVWRLAPFVNAQDLFNLRIGNPYIQPEYTDNFEVGFIRSSDVWNVTGTVFYRNTRDAMSRVFTLFGETGLVDPTGTISSDATIVTWANANRQENGGVELVNQVSASDKLDFTITSSFFQSRISGATEELGEFANETFSWTLNVLSNWIIPKWFSVQVMSNYRGPIVLPQGTIDPIFSLNLGLRREILNRKATISVNVNDIFNTQQFVINTETSSFNQRRMFNRETRIITLSFSYRFNDYKEKPPKIDAGFDIDD